MKPIISLAILSVYGIGCLYLITVGFLGAIYGEPLGFLFMALGVIGVTPYIGGYYARA